MNKQTEFVYNDIFKVLDYDINDAWSSKECEDIAMSIILDEDYEKSPHQAAIFYALKYLDDVDYDAISINLQFDHGVTIDLTQFGYAQ